MEVPADGDCMAWTLRTLFMGHHHASKFETKQAKEEIRRIRAMIASAWQKVKHDPSWQTLFDAYAVDRVEEEVPKTPEKQTNKPNKNTSDHELDSMLQTPPRPDPPQPDPLSSVGFAGGSPEPFQHFRYGREP